MLFSRNCRIGLVATCLLVATALPAFGASDAEQALDAARTAFDNGQFEKSRDLLVTAAQTDAKNPDIRLLLGKSYYQLGELNKAMAAWRVTLQLAPKQAYALRMIDVLSGQALDVDTRLKVVAGLLKNRIYQPVSVELATIRSKNLSDDQRLQLLELSTEYYLGTQAPQSALRSLGELAVRFPEKHKAGNVQLLLARARVATAGDSLAAGLALLETLAKEQAESPLGPAAEIELIAFRLRQRTAKIDTVLAWIAKNAGHAQQLRAQEELIFAIQQLLSDTAQGPAPKPENQLSDGVKSALAAAAKAFAAMTTASDADALTAMIIQHLETRYASNRAFDAAGTGLKTLEAIKLMPSSQRLVVAFAKRLGVKIATAEYSDIVAKLAQNLDETKALIAWIKNHPDHPQRAAARQALLDWY